MTPRQNAAYADHRKKRRAYETAIPGDKNRRRKELEAAALEVLRADTEAERREERRVHA